MTSVAEDKNSWAGQLNGQLLCFRRILQEARVWRNKLAGEYKVLLGVGGGRRGRGSQATPTEAKGAGGGGRSSTGERPKPKTLWAQKAGLPGERKVQVSRREAMKSTMWAAGENLATS